jgi:hypothetical protein
MLSKLNPSIKHSNSATFISFFLCKISSLVHLHLYSRLFFRKTVKNRRKTVAEMKISAIFYLGKVLINCISLKKISHVYPTVFPALNAH